MVQEGTLFDLFLHRLFRTTCPTPNHTEPYRLSAQCALTLLPTIPTALSAFALFLCPFYRRRLFCLFPTLSLTCRPACLLDTVIGFCFCLLSPAAPAIRASLLFVCWSFDPNHSDRACYQPCSYQCATARTPMAYPGFSLLGNMFPPLVCLSCPCFSSFPPLLGNLSFRHPCHAPISTQAPFSRPFPRHLVSYLLPSLSHCCSPISPGSILLVTYFCCHRSLLAPFFSFCCFANPSVRHPSPPLLGRVPQVCMVQEGTLFDLFLHRLFRTTCRTKCPTPNHTEPYRLSAQCALTLLPTIPTAFPAFALFLRPFHRRRVFCLFPTLSLTCRPACLLDTVIGFCFCLLHLRLLPSGFLYFGCWFASSLRGAGVSNTYSSCNCGSCHLCFFVFVCWSFASASALLLHHGSLLCLVSRVGFRFRASLPILGTSWRSALRNQVDPLFPLLLFPLNFLVPA